MSSKIHNGDTVTVQTRNGIVITNVAYTDDEGIMRIDDGIYEINLTPDSEGYFKYGIVVISVTRP
jgi:hypothetical protein